MPPRKNSQATVAELSLVQLQKCFVNLPANLVNLLLNVDTVGSGAPPPYVCFHFSTSATTS